MKHKEQAHYHNYFSQNRDLHHYNTRSAKKLHKDYHRTNYAGKFSLKAISTKILNNLPDEVKNSRSYYIFKGKMKLILLNNLVLDCLNFSYIK